MFVRDCDNSKQNRKKTIHEVYFPTNSISRHEIWKKIVLKLLSTLNKTQNYP
jgi:hypothetical protein